MRDPTDVQRLPDDRDEPASRASSAATVPAGEFWMGYLRRLAAAGCAALLVGVLTGLGARLGMRLLAVQNPQAVGLRTDDDFEIGVVSLSGTVNLLGATIAFSMLGASLYLMIRPALFGPTWLRAVTAAVGGGVTVGALLVVPDAFDFVALGPPLLPVFLFVAIPVVHVVVFVFVAERWMRNGSWFQRAPRRWVLSTLLLWLFSGLALILVVVLLGLSALALAALRVGSPGSRVRAGLTWAGRAVLVLIFLGGATNLIADIGVTV